MKVFDRENYRISIQELEIDECQQRIADTPIEGLVLKFTEERNFDVGALCYLHRGRAGRGGVKKVDIRSLRTERVKAMRLWITHKITLYYTTKSAYTIYQNATALNGIFTWADNHGYHDLLVSPESYHGALQAYTQHLNSQLKNKKIKQFAANRLQSEALHSGQTFFPGTSVSFYDDLPLICNQVGTEKPTEPPTQAEIEAYLTPCQYLFDGLTDFLLNFGKFPARTQFMTEYLWLLPGEYPFVSKEAFAANPKLYSNLVWNYISGEIRDLDDACKLSVRHKYQVHQELKNARILMRDANDNFRHEKRLRLAKIAHDAFIPLFTANSGMNEEQIRNIPFKNDYTPFNSDKKGFTGIKLRADGHEVNFTIRKTFLKQFEKYLRLRQYICGQSEQKFLFIGMGIHGRRECSQLRPSEILKLNKRIEIFLIPNFNGLSYRKLRKYKSNFLLSSGKSIQVVSTLLQTAQATVLKNYTQANETTAVAEITAMMKRLVELLEDYTGSETPAGDCADPDGHSDAIPPPPDYEPNCKDFEGCIFCSQFRTHANEDSVRKLLSMRFVTLEYLNSCSDEAHFQKVHGAAIAQIDRIISQLQQERPSMEQMIKSISSEITNNFELSAYWKRFYHRMVKLKVMK